VLPDFNGSGEWPFWLAAAIGVGLAAFFARELRRATGTTRAY